MKYLPFNARIATKLQEGQYTLVTETHGPLQGKRVVRGRESECRRYYLT